MIVIMKTNVPSIISSDIDLCKLRPISRNPIEYRASFSTRKTRSTLSNLRIRIINRPLFNSWVVVSQKQNDLKIVSMKNGIIESTSMIDKGFLMKIRRFGVAQRRRKYSRMNHATQIASAKSRLGSGWIISWLSSIMMLSLSNRFLSFVLFDSSGTGNLHGLHSKNGDLSWSERILNAGSEPSTNTTIVQATNPTDKMQNT